MTQKDKDAVIAALEELKGDGTGLVAMTVEDCIAVVNGLPVSDGWIAVTERLPKTGERVLVCIGAVFEAFIDDDGKWQRYYSAPLNEVLGEPTHWMPLPKPPGEVS